MENEFEIGKPDPEHKKKVILTNNSPFLNTDCIFVEYNDIIKSPFFVLLNYIKDTDVLKEIYDLSDIENLNLEELYEWYIQREERVVFNNLKPANGALSKFFDNNEENFKKFSEEFMYKEIEELDYVVKIDGLLPFHRTLNAILSTDMVMTGYVYTERYSKVIEEDLKRILSDKVIYVYGDLVEVLKQNKITDNSTFVFSDVTKVLKLEEAGIIDYSSILLADRYEYNYESADILRIDMDRLTKDHIFKMDIFDNIS